MTDQSLTHLYVLLDRSGSMQSIKQDMEGGYAAFVEQQRSVPGRCTVSLAQFDHEYSVVYSGVDLAQVPPLVLQPRGRTALLDAMGRYINQAGSELAGLDEDARPGTVIMVILTDGLENASREFTLETVRAMVKEQTDVYSWTFVYLGADQDAISVAGQIGIRADMSLTYSRGRVREAFAGTAANLAGMRAAVAAGASIADAASRAGFSDEQRKAADQV